MHNQSAVHTKSGEIQYPKKLIPHRAAPPAAWAILDMFDSSNLRFSSFSLGC